MPYWDRFDIVEAWFVSACDAGDYALVSRMQRYFRPRPSLCFATLSENARLIYAQRKARNRS